MNCREVTDILDNQMVVKLEPAQKREAEAHVAGCAECASAWHLQTGLADLPNMTLPADFASSCRALVASGSRDAPGRRTARRVLVGTLAALAAAAALFVILPRQSAFTRSADNGPPTAVVDDAPAIPETVSTESPVEPQSAAIEISVTPHFLVRALRPGSQAETDARGDDPGPYPPALAEQLRAYQNEPSRKHAVDSFYDALIGELQRIPGLMLVDSDLTKLEPSSSRKYQLHMGDETQISRDGKIVRRSSRYLTMDLNAVQIRSSGKSVIRLMSSADIDLQAPCTGAAPAADNPCPDPQGAAATLVRKLREQVFPPDPSVTRALQAKLQDSSLDAAQRSKSLFDLLKIQDNTDDLSLLRDPGVVRATIDLAANADPTLRARIWRAMRSVGSKDLIQPLMNSLVNDPVEVRLAALETLADFRDDARVRSTLESVALGDARPLVRAVAERGLSGEGPWRQYVVTSLKDSNRSAPERTDALMYYLYPPGAREYAPSHPDYWQIMQELLDDGAVSALAQTLPGAGSLRGFSNNFVGNFAGLYSKNPAVTGMLLTLLENDSRPNMRAVAGVELARQHAGEPRVRDALTRAVQNDPDARVRDGIRQITGSNAP